MKFLSLSYTAKHKVLPLSKGEKMTKIHITKKSVWNTTKYMVLLVVLAIWRAVSTYVFIIPNGFAPGGVSGIASIIYNVAIAFDRPDLASGILDPGVMTFLLNIPLLIFAFITLNKRFAFNTLCVVAVYSGFISLFGLVKMPQYIAGDDTGYKLLAAIAGGAMGGFGMGLMLRSNMSMGGTDIIGKAIYKRNSAADTQWWIMACDCVVAIASGTLGLINLDMTVGTTAILTSVLSPIFYSFITLFTTAGVADVIQAGFQSSIVFNIISDYADEIAEEISNTLHRGTTISSAIGHYTGREHKMLVCVVSKKQINVVKRIIHSIDPQAFTYITKAREVAGKGFRSVSED